MKSRTKQSSYQLLLRTVGQHLSIVLFLLLSMGVVLGTTTTQAQTGAYVTNDFSGTVSVIDAATNTVVPFLLAYFLSSWPSRRMEPTLTYRIMAL